MLKRLIKLILSPYRAYIKSLEKSIDGIMELDEPLRSQLLYEIMFGDSEWGMF